MKENFFFNFSGRRAFNMYLESEYAELKKKFRAEWGYFIELCKKGANLANLI